MSNVVVNRETKKIVAFRCEKHRDVPVLNLNVDGAECGICTMDQAADGLNDALLARVGEIVDSASTQLEFLAPGSGLAFREQAARIIDSWGADEDGAESEGKSDSDRKDN